MHRLPTREREPTRERGPAPDLPLPGTASPGTTAVGEVRLAGFWAHFVGLVPDSLTFAVVNWILSAMFVTTSATIVSGSLTATTSTGAGGLVKVMIILPGSPTYPGSGSIKARARGRCWWGSGSWTLRPAGP